MSFTYTQIDGERVETSVARAFESLKAEFRRVWGLELLVSSGTRTRAEQQRLYDLYRAGKGNLAAVPGTSNHEEYGPRGPRALDVRDSGGDPGVTRYGTARANWLRANAPRFGFDPAGYGFSQTEPWHIEYTGALGQGSSGSNPDGSLVVDGDWGAATTTKLQAALGVTQDGQLGPQTIGALQDRVGAGRDGEMGPQTIAALQRRLGVEADGQLGPITIKALQAHLNAGGTLSAPASNPDRLAEDGQLGPATISKLQASIGAGVDGGWGPETTKRLQAVTGQNQDGQLGPITIKALQLNVGAEPDGDMGPATIKALQVFLNNGGQWRAVVVETPATNEPEAPAATPRPPLYPGAARGWLVPLSSNRVAGETIDKLIVHHTTNTRSEEDYFKSKNDRSSCPTWYGMSDGTVVELIAPDKRPSATAGKNTGSVAIELQNTTAAPDWKVADAALEAVAQIAAWLSQQASIGGIPVTFKLDRQHLIGHNEAGANATACPGPYVAPRLDLIVERAKQIVAAAQPTPQPEPPVGSRTQLRDEAFALMDQAARKIDLLARS